jgi:hypothetical protein
MIQFRSQIWSFDQDIPNRALIPSICTNRDNFAPVVSFEANFLNIISEESSSDKYEIELERAQELDTSCNSTCFFSSCIISIGEDVVS